MYPRLQLFIGLGGHQGIFQTLMLCMDRRLMENKGWGGKWRDCIFFIWIIKMRGGNEIGGENFALFWEQNCGRVVNYASESYLKAGVKVRVSSPVSLKVI